jgi:cytochrome c oxidase assembly protein subunit 11
MTNSRMMVLRRFIATDPSLATPGLSRINTRVALRLLAVAGGMFAFGYLLVPIYDVLCRATGLNGKTINRATVAESTRTVDLQRTVSVEMLGSVNAALPWEFRAAQPNILVHPGTVHTVEYIARNKLPVPVVGQAVPSVAPGSAAQYFKKIECFCFTPQRLEPFEERKLTVRFYLDATLPKSIGTVTLAYTLFQAPTVESADRI